ncbi:MAG: site-specific integrase [Chloroflexota bacterium]
MFTNTIGRHLDASTVTHQFQALLAEAGLPRIRFHDLRHSCATLLLNDGVPLHTVSRLLGHSQIAITADTYGHLVPDAARQDGRTCWPVRRSAELMGLQMGLHAGPQGRVAPIRA